MNPRRFAIVLVGLGLVAVVAYVFSAGRARVAEHRAEAAAFALAHPGGKGTLVTLDIDGMSCPDCARTVGSEIEKVHGVVACRVDLERSVAEVRLASADMPTAPLLAAVQDAGYEAKLER